jgi:hypothetical protein
VFLVRGLIAVDDLATIFDRRGLQRLLRAKGLPHLIEHAKPARAPPQAELDFGA